MTKLTYGEDKALLAFIEFVRDDHYGCNAAQVKKKGRTLLRAVKAGEKVHPKDFNFYGW